MKSITTTATFSANLRARRKQIRMDPVTCSNLLGIPVETLDMWESGHNPGWTLDQLAKISEVLCTTIAELVPDVDTDLDNGGIVQFPADQAGQPGICTLVRTRTIPSFIPMIVDVTAEHTAEDPGHIGNEFIYVLNGEVIVKWGNPDDPREAVLPAGSSFYVAPNTMHTFAVTKSSGPARLLAVNF